MIRPISVNGPFGNERIAVDNVQMVRETSLATNH